MLQAGDVLGGASTSAAARWMSKTLGIGVQEGGCLGGLGPGWLPMSRSSVRSQGLLLLLSAVNYELAQVTFTGGLLA